MTLDSGKYLKTLFITSIPVVLQQLLQNSLSFIDTLMIGKLGAVEIAAVGLGGQVFFFIAVVFFGISSGGSIFSSQFWGSGNRNGIQKTMGLSLVISISVSALFSFVSILFPEFLIRIFTEDKDVVRVGSEYLRWVGISYVFVAVSQVLAVTIRATGDTAKPMYITFISMILDVIGNWFLIFKAGLGACGAAVATTVSRAVEMILFCFFIFRSPVKPDFKMMFSFDSGFAKEVLSTAVPVIVDDGLWALGVTLYKVVFARMGVDVLAASNVTESVKNIFFTIQNGIGAGTAIIIGNTIGRKRYEEAQGQAVLSMKFAFALGGVMTILIMISRNFISGLFNVGDSIVLMTSAALFAESLSMPFKFANHLNVCGVARSGGDTKFILIAELISMWGIGVPFAFLGGLVWKLPLWGVYLLISAEEISKLCICIPRIRKGKWINDLVNKPET